MSCLRLQTGSENSLDLLDYLEFPWSVLHTFWYKIVAWQNIIGNRKHILKKHEISKELKNSKATSEAVTNG